MQCPTIDTIVGAYNGFLRDEELRTPEGQARAAEVERQIQEREKKLEERKEQEEEDRKREEAERLVKQAELASLERAQNEALEEVGFTMERHDRQEMKSVVFLIKEELHAILRQAAFDNHITMQEVLRRGMLMWFTAHGYDVVVSSRSPAKRGSIYSHAEVRAKDD